MSKVEYKTIHMDVTANLESELNELGDLGYVMCHNEIKEIWTPGEENKAKKTYVREVIVWREK